MIEEKVAVEIAKLFLASKGIDVDEFAQANFVAERHIWACCFLNKMEEDYVDAPGITIVDVDCFTGKASFFDTM